jgi:hypothetical protein
MTSDASDADVAALRHEELVALVQQLRHQLAERDREIEHLRRQGAESRTPSDVSAQGSGPAEPQEPSPGSQEDLLLQLEQLYP